MNKEIPEDYMEVPMNKCPLCGVSILLGETTEWIGFFRDVHKGCIADIDFRVENNIGFVPKNNLGCYIDCI